MNLRIHKISISDFNSLDTVIPTTLYFNYANQTDFTSTPNNTRFDCEAFVAIGDSLVLFSKNWTMNNTSLYTLSKTPGTYSLPPIDSLETSFKVTDASFNSNTQKLALVGYNLTPFAMRLDNINTAADVLSASSFSCELLVTTSFQVEGVTYVDDRLFISSERFTFGNTILPPAISEITDLETSVFIEANDDKIKITQAPEMLNVNAFYQTIQHISLYNSQGQLIKYLTVNNPTTNLNTSNLNKGLYILMLKLQNGKSIIKKIVI